MVPSYPYKVSVSRLSKGFCLTWVCFAEEKTKQEVVNWDIPKNINPPRRHSNHVSILKTIMILQCLGHVWRKEKCHLTWSENHLSPSNVPALSQPCCLLLSQQRLVNQPWCCAGCRTPLSPVTPDPAGFASLAPLLSSQSCHLPFPRPLLLPKTPLCCLRPKRGAGSEEPALPAITSPTKSAFVPA